MQRMKCRILLALLLFPPSVFADSTNASVRPVWRMAVPEKGGMQRFPVAAGLLGSNGRDFSIEIHLRPGALQHPGTLFEVLDTGGQPAIQLVVTPKGTSNYESLIQFRVITDFRPEPLTVGLPVKLLDGSARHDLVLRDLGYRLDLFVDGVLSDQEWPIGGVAAKGTSSAEATSSIADVQIWLGTLPDSTIQQKNGGGRAIAKRDQEFFGPVSAPMQYWRPHGYNTSAGDAMPFFHDGVLHLFFLLDRRHHQSKWGLGAHQWGHTSTRDLIHWKTYPAALTIEHEGEASICTGSVFFQDKKFYAFYATRMPDRSEHLGMAVSDDGIAFHKLLPSPFDEPRPPYRRGPNRDPFVFGEGNDFHMIVTASLAAPASPDRAGALEHLTSADLKTWKVEPAPFLITGYAADPECSDLFFWHGWYYLLFSEDGQAHYRMSRSRSGPWTTPSIDVFDGKEARVMKTAAFTGDRRIGVAFVPEGGFGGHLVFREILQSTDGTLRTSFPREMTPHGSSQTKPAVKAAEGNVEITAERIVLRPQQGSSASASIGRPANFMLSATLIPGQGAARYGFSFGASGSGTGGSTLEINPSDRRVAWKSMPTSGAAAPPSLDGVEELAKPVKIKLVVQGTIADLDINGSRTLIHRLPEPSLSSLSVFSEGGDLTITDLKIEPIGQTP